MSFDQLVNKVPWLRTVPGLQNILKYIPLSSKEKSSHVYRRNAISVREWSKLPFITKKQYLVIRGESKQQFFTDISDNNFVANYLPKYPQLAEFIAITPNVIDPVLLLRNLDKFNSQDRKSITANLRVNIDTKYLPSDILSFDVKKLLVKLNKWNIKGNERLYVTNDGSTIVRLTLGDDIKVGLFQAEDDYPNVKLNKRTSKYLLDYPELDKIPLKNLVKLSEEGTIDKNVVTTVLNNAKNDPNSALVVKPTENGEIILDSNSFSSYKVENGEIKSIPFGDEAVQKVFEDSKDNEAFQQNALNIFKTQDNIPPTIDKNALKSVINAIPYNQRTIQYANAPTVVLTADGDPPFFMVPVTLNPRQHRPLVNYDNSRGRNTYSHFTPEQITSFFDYLRSTNQAYNDEGLKLMLGQGGSGMGEEAKKAFIASNPPLVAGGNLRPAVANEKIGRAHV